MPPDTLVEEPIRAKHRPRFRRAAADERPAFRLTDRDREALRIIYAYRWITADLLQDLLPEVKLTDPQKHALSRLKAVKKATALGTPQRTKREVQRRLQYLYHHGFVQRHKLADGEAIAYALGNRGADELMLSFGIDRQQIEWTTKNRESSERFLRHAMMVTSFRHAVEVSLRALPALQLKLWEPGGAFQAKVQYEDTVRTQGGTRTQLVDGTVKPDSLFLLLHHAKGIHYFPEADRSTMSNSRYLSKLKAYYAFYATYVRDNPSSPIKQMRVLTITRSEERKQNLRKIAQQVSPEAKNLFWFLCEKVYLGQPQKVFEPTWQTLEDDTLKSLYGQS
jgi:protein involved in plasmid replication-relaxation